MTGGGFDREAMESATRFIKMLETIADDALAWGKLTDGDARELQRARQSLDKAYVTFTVRFIAWIEETDRSQAMEGYERLQKLMEAVFDIGVYATFTSSAQAFFNKERQRKAGRARAIKNEAKVLEWQQAVDKRIDRMLTANPNLNGTDLAKKIEDEKRKQDERKREQAKQEKAGGGKKTNSAANQIKNALPDSLPEFDQYRSYIRKRLRQRKMSASKNGD